MVACCLIVFSRGVTKQHFFCNISYNTIQHFFKNILNTLDSPPPSRDDGSASESSPESILKDCKTSKRAQVGNTKNAQPKAKITRTTLTKFAKKISLGLVNKGMWRENCFYCTRVSTTENNKFAWGDQTSTT